MKKALLLLMSLLLLLAGCAEQDPQIQQSKSIDQVEHDKSEIDYRTGIYYEKFWETECLEDSDYCVIPDVEAAVKIATAIYHELPISTYPAQSVFLMKRTKCGLLSFMLRFLRPVLLRQISRFTLLHSKKKTEKFFLSMLIKTIYR